MLRKIAIGLLVLTPLLANAGVAVDLTELIKNKIRVVQHIALNPLLVKAVRQQNAQQMDEQQVAQRVQAQRDNPLLLEAIMQNDHMLLMRRFVESQAGFTDIYVTDKRGGNVAAYPISDDYWLGNEQFWLQSYNRGEGQVFIGPLERDGSSNIISTYVAAPVLDRNQTIGVVRVNFRLANNEIRGR